MALSFRLPRAPSFSVPAVASVLGLAATGGGLVAIFTARVQYWTVMSDEMFYAKIARAFAGGTLIPHVRGTRVDYFPFLYSVLMAPFYGSLGTRSAFHAVHILNGFLMASAAIPAYLIARELLPRAWAWAAAALALALPWIALATLDMTEVVAYPVFLWTFLAYQRALAAPSTKRDAVALVAFAVAFLARRQFVVLALVLPIAALAFELTASSRMPVRARLRELVRSHRVLAIGYGVAAAALVPLAIVGFAPKLLGVYSVTATNGSPVTGDIFESAASHLDSVAIGIGVLPFVIGVAWIYGRALRGSSPGTRAFGVLAAVTIPLIALEAASFNLRFGDAITRDRYVFYVAPILIVAALACLLDTRRPWLWMLASTAFFSCTVAWRPLPAGHYFWVDSGIRTLNGLIVFNESWLSLGAFLALAGLIIGALAAAAVRRFPRRVLAAGFVMLTFGFGGAVAGLNYYRFFSLPGPDGNSMASVRGPLDWVDRTIGTDARVSIFPVPFNTDWFTSAVSWWDLEFWNDSVDRAFVDPRGMIDYTPFQHQTYRLDFGTGRLAGTTDAPPYAVLADLDPRLGVVGRHLARQWGFSLYALPRPYRVAWATRGLDVDGWTDAGRPVRIRLYADAGTRPRMVKVNVFLLSAPGAGSDTPFSLTRRSGGAVHGKIPVGHSANAVMTACVPAGGHADLTLRVATAAQIPGPPLGDYPSPTNRSVGALVGSIVTTPVAGRCGTA